VPWHVTSLAHIWQLARTRWVCPAPCAPSTPAHCCALPVNLTRSSTALPASVTRYTIPGLPYTPLSPQNSAVQSFRNAAIITKTLGWSPGTESDCPDLARSLSLFSCTAVPQPSHHAFMRFVLHTSACSSHRHPAAKKLGSVPTCGTVTAGLHQNLDGEQSLGPSFNFPPLWPIISCYNPYVCHAGQDGSQPALLPVESPAP
jgi:hypothetical protein